MATVERLYVHPAYTVINPVTGVYNDNDIALIRLAHPITFTDNIRPICLPTAYGQYLQQFAEKTYTAAGWGRTTPGGPGSDTLMAVKVPVVSKGECEISYTESQYYWFVCPRGVTCRHVISDKQLCAGGIQGEGTCDGDSGGPLMMSDGLNPTTYYVVGITSYGMKKKDGSCVSGVPDVFTRVSEYIPWILDTIY
ncbi:CLIP domain-containing serine protease 14D-like [Homalodisca vitripennis]|uniref:CLIP domain-containing serine protease 14D-like n=1 Tax=Homalodisca vitripennis TaxID=197043 RepID=UPI001EE9C752|nr:CLIP domain-containing serine protease 14D-like [Homalodisca vitripennis]